MWNALPKDVLQVIRREVSRREYENWQQYVDAVEQYRELADDYDGQGAIAPADETIDGAIALIHELIAAGVATPTYAVPGPNGTVNLNWEYPGVSASVEVVDADNAETMVIGAEEQMWQLSRAVEEAA
jgi:hypothetical protein